VYARCLLDSENPACWNLFPLADSGVADLQKLGKTGWTARSIYGFVAQSAEVGGCLFLCH
jgi:hypothetical protein